ncbi:MAG: diguanylate cyclase [Lachnospiraceae bacterium]
MQKKMKSIQTKIILLITTALLTLSVFVGGFSLWNTGRVVLNDTELMMEAVCTEQALRLDNQLERTEQAVTTMYHYAVGELTSFDIVLDQTQRDLYTSKIQDLALDISNNTDGAMAVYFRFNPEFTDTMSGFFWTKKEADGPFTTEPLTDLGLYDKNDVEHVGWFYQPVEAGHAVWMSPYYNKNIGVEMISYVIPIFYEDALVGVIGMDIDFTLFVDLAQEAAVYESGRANLVDMSAKTIYYREADDDDVAVRSAIITDKLYNNLVAAPTSGEKSVSYTVEDKEYKLVFRTVRNGMKYVLYSPTAEINAERNSLLTGIVFLTLCILVVFLIFTTYMTRKIIRPLRELNDAAKQMAQGNLDVKLQCDFNDEIGTLTNSIAAMADRLKVYVEEINALAYKDGLTGVKNKTSYIDYTENLTKEKDVEYAVALFDVNNLKILNDTYGHEQGDAMIVLACSYICRVFRNSPVFRIGGDEFVVILRGEDYRNKESLLQHFADNMSREKLDITPFCELSVAFGMATKEADESFEEVFRQADREMYRKKKEMKDII